MPVTQRYGIHTFESLTWPKVWYYVQKRSHKVNQMSVTQRCDIKIPNPNTYHCMIRRKQDDHLTTNNHQQLTKTPVATFDPQAEGEREGKATGSICLTPELCSMTGLTETIRADFRVMKNIEQHTCVGARCGGAVCQFGQHSRDAYFINDMDQHQFSRPMILYNDTILVLQVELLLRLEEQDHLPQRDTAVWYKPLWLFDELLNIADHPFFEPLWKYRRIALHNTSDIVWDLQGCCWTPMFIPTKDEAIGR